LFAGAHEPRRLLRERIATACAVQELPVYDNRPAKQTAVSRAAVLVFTSPMNAQAYFSTHSLLPGQQIVAIGRSTQGALYALGIQQVVLAASPDEAALAAAVLGIQDF
jgi:uroporphyrinogen-III synthase